MALSPVCRRSPVSLLTQLCFSRDAPSPRTHQAHRPDKEPGSETAAPREGSSGREAVPESPKCPREGTAGSGSPGLDAWV